MMTFLVGYSPHKDDLGALDRIRVPTLVICGGRDAMFDPSEQQRLAAALGARLAVHPEAGHATHWEHPEWLAGELARFLDASA